MAADNENQQVTVSDRPRSWLNPFSWVESWKYSTMAALAKVERKILQSVWEKLEQKFVPIQNSTKEIRTISMNTSSKNTPLVLLHGMGSGVGLWILNLEALSKNRPLYAFDMLGFGRSSRPKFCEDALLAETEFVESIEEWRKEMGLEKFILLGHSLGGFVASSYTIRFPEKVRHLILVDPWGFPEKPNQRDQQVPVPLWIKVVAKMLEPFNPLAALRAAGPWGPGLVAKFRPDLTRKFEHLFDDHTVSEYVFHCNAQKPSGETAFKNMTVPFGWAKHPMVLRIGDIPRLLPMTVIYGSRSWVDSGVGYQIKYIRNESYVDVQVIKGAGHHVYADKAYQFNSMVSRVCQTVDNRMDFGQPFTQSMRHGRSPNSETSTASPNTTSPRRKLKSESLPTFSKLQRQMQEEHKQSTPVARNADKKPAVTIPETPEQSSIDSATSREPLSEPSSLDERRISFMLGEDYLPVPKLDTDESDLTQSSETGNTENSKDTPTGPGDV